MSNAEIQTDLAEANELNGNVTQEKVRKGWVKFDDESPKTTENDILPSVLHLEGASTSAPTESAAVLKTETVHINLERGDKNVEPISLGTLSKNVEFVNVRQGFSNGDIIVTLLPVNTKWPWVTAAHFRPELVPEELMAQGLTERGALLYLRYAGRWGSQAVKNRLNLGSLVPGRHGDKYVCPCQFIEEHLKVKPPAGIAKYFTLPNQNVQVY